MIKARFICFVARVRDENGVTLYISLPEYKRNVAKREAQTWLDKQQFIHENYQVKPWIDVYLVTETMNRNSTLTLMV